MVSHRLPTFAPRISTLRWGVGSFSALVGSMMLVTPSQFNSPVYSILRPGLQGWGVTFLLVGVGLIGLVVFRPRSWVIYLVHFAGGLDFLLLAYNLALVGGWTGTSNFACLGLGVLAAPLLERRAGGRPPNQSHEYSDSQVRSRGDHPDLLPLTLGVGAALSGLSFLALPGQFGSALYDPVRPYLPFFGVAFLVGGLGLAYTHSGRSESRTLRRSTHVLVSATFLAFFAVSAYPLRAWTGMAYYGGFGLGLILQPWIGSPSAQDDSTSLQSRLAFSFAVLAGIPLILAVALVEELTSRAAGASPEVDRARDLAFLVLLVATVVAAYVGTLISSRLAQPLKGLSRAADELARGRDAAPLPKSRVAEVDSLTRAFGEMRDLLAARTSESERLLWLVREQAARAEQRAAELDAVLNSIADALIIYDRRGDAVRLNKAAERILGYSREDFVGDLRARSDRIGPRRSDDRPYSFEEHPVARALEGVTSNGDTMIFHARGGSVVWASVSYAPIRSEEGTVLGAVMTFSDVTAQRQLEQAREEFLSLVSHDLRNPLTALQLIVSVADQGAGIAAAEMPHLFDKYYRATTDRQVEGLGLGLYISRLLAEAHGGRIWVESEVGRGSVFAFALPLD